jgi:hypothetical protein
VIGVEVTAEQASSVSVDESTRIRGIPKPKGIASPGARLSNAPSTLSRSRDVKRKTHQERSVKLAHSNPLLGVLVASVFCAGSAASQQPGVAVPEARTNAIVASFNKSKHVSKEKRGVIKEKYVDVRSEPVTKPNPADYSGTYEADGLGFALQIRVDRDGKAEGSGYEPLYDDAGVSRLFTLRDGRIRGALITAKKVYANGSVEPLEGVFIKRTTFESPTDKGFTTFGLGVVGKRFRVDGLDLDRVFYQLKQ